jgi:transposase
VLDESGGAEKVKGVGMLIALAFLLTLEDSQRVRKSRDLGCYLCLEPGRRNSGQSEPQTHTSKECDPYLRTLLVPGTHHILSPFGLNSDLRRWDLSWPSVAASGTVSRRPSQLS